WAIISSPRLQETGLAELLATELSQRKTFELVEREQINLALRELEVDRLLGSESAGGRLKLGQVLRADGLVFLGEAPAEGVDRIKVVVRECRQGARLG